MSGRKPERTPPPPIPARVWKISAVTGAGAFMAMLDSTVANLAVESIRADFTSTLPVAQWVVTGYLGALAVSLPAAGWLGGRFGYGALWTGSLAGFVLASALCGFAPDAATLIGARVLQGLAGGLMVPAGQAVIGATARPNQLGRIMGVLGLVVALGPALGPAFGGLLLDSVSWRWVFWINVPVGVAALLAARGLVPAGATRTDRPLDRTGLFLLAFGLPLLLYGAAGIGTAAVIAVLAGAVLTAAFVFRVRHAEHPLIDLGLLRRGTFAAATATAGLTGAGMYGGLLLLPLFLQLAFGMDTIGTGFMLLAMGLGSAVALPFAGALTDRHGAGPVSVGGAVLLFASTVPFLFADLLSTSIILGVLVARGAGLALAQMPAMTAAYAAVTTEEMGDAATLVNIVQRVGGAAGAIGVVIAVAHAGTYTGATTYIGAFALLALLAALTAVSAMILRRRESPESG